MQVLVVRHAPAEDREIFALTGKSDDQRPLTEKGIIKMRKNIQGIQQVVPTIHTIATSPFQRTQQTANLLAEGFPHAKKMDLSCLEPNGNMQMILDYLKSHEPLDNVITLVGHEPDLGELVTWLLSGHPDAWFPMKKGAACLLEFTHDVEAGEADLLWALTPKQLRQISS